MKQVLLCCLAMLFIITAQSQTLRVPVQGNQTKMEVSSNTGLSFTANLNISEFTLTKVETPAGYFTQLDVPKFTKRYDDGRPGVPLFSQPVEIPAGANATINIISYEVAEFDLDDLGFADKILPAQPSWSKSTDPSEIVYYYDQDYYSTDSFSNNQLITIGSAAEARSINFGNLYFDPISYNPVSNKIQIKYNIHFSVTFESENYVSYNNEKARFYSPEFVNFYNELPNFQAPPTKDVLTKYPIKYVIVADRMFESTLQSFVQWKTEKGFSVIEAYTDQASVGTTTTSIKSYLQNLYNAGTTTDPAPTYVLFVGDVAQVPTFTGVASTAHKTDLYYCTFGGSSDYIPDMYYGRFSATTVAQLQAQVDKTLEYEKYLMPSTDYLDTVVMIAGVDDGSSSTGGYSQVHANGQINYGTTNYFNPAHGIYSYTYLWPTTNNSSTDVLIRNEIGTGVGYANYTAHGSTDGWADPSFLISHISSMHNAHKYGLLVGNCCQTNTFNNSECFGEALLRAVDKGAIGYIGASNYSYWDEDYYFGVGNRASIVENPTYDASNLGAYDRMFHDTGIPTTSWYSSNGQMIYAGNLGVEASSTSMKKYYWEVYHLMGDPSVMTYFSKPDPLTISYASPAQVGNTSLVVNTEQYTYVAISLNGVLLDAEYSGTNTSVTLNFPAFTTVDTALVVATKQNKIPHIGNLPIEDVSVTLDAQVITILKPTGTYACTNISETPQIVVKNRGINNLTSVTIKYKLDAGTLQTASWSGNLATNQSDTMNLTAITIPAGTSTFLAYTINPNGSADMNMGNDSATVTFTATNLPIVANFTSSATSFCAAPGTITLDNTSTNASSYVWNFGDGNTSTVAEPTYTYTTNGLYTLSLTADGGVCGSDSYDIAIMVGSQPPVINDTTACGAQSFLLTASGSNIQWYSDAAGTTLLGSGTTYTTPVLSSPATYYLNSVITNNSSVGMPDNSGTGSYTSSADNYQIFDALDNFTLVSIDVYAQAAGTRNFELRSSTGTQIATFAYPCAAGLNTVPVNFSVPAGTNLQLGLVTATTANLWRHSAGVSYPYTVPGVVSITNSSYGSDRYYYFYNWQIQQNCYSSMESVTCSILPTPTANFTASATTTCANTTITLTDATTGSPNAWSWSVTPATYSFVGGTNATSQNPQIQFTTAGNYNIQLTSTSSCGSDVESKSNFIAVTTPPAQPAAISGNNAPCANTTGLTYSVTNVGGVTYNWNVPSGWTITAGAGTNSITVTAGSNAGAITVTPNNGCDGTPQTMAVSVNTAPAQPATIAGQIGPCQLGSETYSVTTVAGVSYTWSVPADWTISSGQNTNSISVNVGTQSGNITVTPSNGCGNGTPQILSVTSSLMPTQPTAINGDDTPCQTAQTYSVSNTSGITYNWTFPTGWAIVSGQGTNSISVIPSATAGTISVTPSNGCGNGTARTFTATPEQAAAQPSVVSGSATPCAFSTATFSVLNVVGISYTWTVPSGWTISAGQGTNSITVTTGSSSGVITVTPSTACGNGTPQTFTVSTAAYPVVDLGTDTSICNDQVLTLDAGNGGILYQWSTGANTQSIAIDASTLTAGSGYTYQVTVTNAAGCSSTDAIGIEVMNCSGIGEDDDLVIGLFPNPAQDVITVTCSEDILRIEILDTRGALVFGGKFNENFAIINTSALSQGLYYVRVITAHGTNLSPLAIDK